MSSGSLTEKHGTGLAKKQELVGLESCVDCKNAAATIFAILALESAWKNHLLIVEN